MSDPIYPRSPCETMCGWMHLPRSIDKIRLHLAGEESPGRALTREEIQELPCGSCPTGARS
ncbi:MAG: DUF5069 domain-containing protein [Verrucomicrobia bacterium]|nr:DUF5069 domain-containing protein [Verrucomicrobiota bacterium]